MSFVVDSEVIIVGACQISMIIIARNRVMLAAFFAFTFTPLSVSGFVVFVWS